MNEKELRRYVYEQHISGMSDTQIAKKLGMTIEELAEKLNRQIGIDISAGTDHTIVKEDVVDNSDEDDGAAFVPADNEDADVPDEDDDLLKGYSHTF